MLRSDGKDPMAVDVMPLVRTHLEMLYAICLIVENPDALALYLKDGWKKLYIQYLLKRQESLALPRFQEGLRPLNPSGAISPRVGRNRERETNH